MANESSFRWFKVLLEPDSKYRNTIQPVKDSNTLLRTMSKNAQDIVADYLKFLWQYAEEDIRKHTQSNWKEIYSVKVVITVPAMWSHVAQDRTRKAALSAGITDNVSIVTEPEAAALAVFKDRDEMGLSLKVSVAVI